MSPCKYNFLVTGKHGENLQEKFTYLGSRIVIENYYTVYLELLSSFIFFFSKIRSIGKESYLTAMKAILFLRRNV